MCEPRILLIPFPGYLLPLPPDYMKKSLCAALHTTISSDISAIIIDIYFALVYVQSKSMWTVVIIHAAIDGTTFVLYSLLSAEAFQASGTAALLAGQIVLQSMVVPLLMMRPFPILVKLRHIRIQESLLVKRNKKNFLS